jgi:hypothetical protein
VPVGAEAEQHELEPDAEQACVVQLGRLGRLERRVDGMQDRRPLRLA